MAEAVREPGAPRFFLEPRTVTQYLHNFKVALEEHFNTENPGQTEDYHLLGIVVYPNKMRFICIFVAHAPIATARKITRIRYKLPVDPMHVNLFPAEHAEPGHALPSAGPYIDSRDVPDGMTAEEFLDNIYEHAEDGPPEGRFSFWKQEIADMREIAESAGEPLPRRRLANRLVQFWTPLRERIFQILTEVGIKNSSSGPHIEWHTPVAATTPANANGPIAPARSSSRARHRRSSQRRRRATRRLTTSDPANARPKNIYNTDPITGKRYRRRRPNSDPKD